MLRKDADFEAFERVMVEVHQRQPIRVLSYCVMSNHWHFVAWPEHDGQLTDFFRRLAQTHAVLARLAPDGGVRASLPGTIQKFPGSE
jgi:putative transposase